MASLPNETRQYLRICKLLVVDQSLTLTPLAAKALLQAGVNTIFDNALDLSQFRIKFQVKRSDTLTPNTADIRVYNVGNDTARRLFSLQNKSKVILEAGYESNSGVIFQGNVKQIIVGRESATDTYVDIVAGDGDRAYNFSVVNTSMAPGANQILQLSLLAAAMGTNGITPGFIGPMKPGALPRGKVLFGQVKNYLRTLSQTSEGSISIQDEVLNFVPNQGFLPGVAPVINADTGMIGAPQQTNIGVNVKCLLNPNIKISSQVFLNNETIQAFKINLTVPNSAANIAPPLNADGIYYVLVAEHTGDTRGTEWYTSLVCINMNVSAIAFNSVEVSYGE